MGLDNFVTDDKSGSNSDLNDEEAKPPWISDFASGKWRRMSPVEKAKYIRENYMEDYRPGLEVDDTWEAHKAWLIECVCGETFSITKYGVCDKCGRAYKDVGRMARLVSEGNNN